MTISTAIRTVLAQHPAASNEQVAQAVRQMVPGASTSAASVASIKSRMRATSNVVPLALHGLMATPSAAAQIAVAATEETDEEVDARIATRYATFERMADRVAKGTCRSLIVSGAPGLGKSFTILQALAEADTDHEVIRGSISAVGLYIALWNDREPGQVLVLDDCDAVFQDDTVLNLLKAVLETGKRRRVSWMKQAAWLAELGIEDSFDFEGGVVFLSNIPFAKRIASGSPIGKHLEALIDRSLYLSLGVQTEREIVARIRQVAPALLADAGLSDDETSEVLDFIAENAGRFHTLSLRLVSQVAELMQADPLNWRDDVRSFKMKA